MPGNEYECTRCDSRVTKDSEETVLRDKCPECGSDLILVDTSHNIDESSDDEEKGKESERIVNPSKITVPGGVEIEPPEDIENIVDKYFDYSKVKKKDEAYIFDIDELKVDNFEVVVNEFKRTNAIPALRKEGSLKLIIVPKEIDEGYNYWINLVLFFITIGSTFLAGYGLSAGNPYVEGSAIVNAAAFSISLLAILGTHEMGHKIMSYKHEINATFPYFIPFPNIIGTMGAVIRMKDPIPNKDAAVDVGSAGPILGAIIAIPVTIIGLYLSKIIPASQVPTEGGIIFGDNLLFLGLQNLVTSVPEGSILMIHPVAIAGWVGLFVTSLNLMPVAQLDGGHISRVVLGEKWHDLLSKLISTTLFGAALIRVLQMQFFPEVFEIPISPIYLLWGLILLFMSRAGHPGALDEINSMSLKRKVIAIIAAVLFIITFTPRAIWITGGF